jgi:3-dehydroquinate dehydratase-1
MICVSVANISYESLISQISEFEMLELRLDLLTFSEEQYQKIIGETKLVIATYRKGTVDDEIRINGLKKAIEQGVDFVDIEIDSNEGFISEMINFAKQNNCKIILSFHDFEETPDIGYLKGIIDKSEALGANYIKIATMAKSKQDISRVLSLYEDNKNLIAFNMGDLGKISRITSLFLGAKFTYASISTENIIAPGQFSYLELKEILNRI